MSDHELKCWPGPFRAIENGTKRFEWRQDDRGFEVGDHILLREWDPRHNCHTDGELTVVVTYILRGQFGVPEGYCVMSIEVL